MNSISLPFKHPAIMVRLPNWVGDVCMCLPALKLLESSGVPYAVTARPWAKDLLSGLPLLDFVPATGKYLNDLKMLRQWHRHHQEIKRAVLMPDSFSTAFIFKLAAFDTIGYRDDGRSWLLKWPIHKPVPRPHAVQSWFGLTRQALLAWGINPTQTKPDEHLGLSFTQSHQEQATQAVLKSGLELNNFVLIAPTAVGRHHGQIKVWSHFDTLTRALQHKGIRVAMCPPPAEKEDAVAAAPTAEVLPALGPGAFSALTRLARLVVCNDSGASHLSAAAGARQCTLFGVTDPTRTGPWTPNSVNLGQNGHWPAVETVISTVQQMIPLPE